MITKAWFTEREFHFTNAAITSRNTLTQKTSFFLFLEDENKNVGIGECSPIYGLSIENEKDLRLKLTEVIYQLNHRKKISDLDLNQFPSLQFALEVAELDMIAGGDKKLFETEFTRGSSSLKINGLIWMGTLENMTLQLRDKIDKGFHCIKIKVGSHDFDKEIAFLKKLRNDHGTDLEVRLDANGAFHPDNALNKLEKLAEFNIHSIEQPIRQGQWHEMSEVCDKSPIPIALDEELIGIKKEDRINLLEKIKPHYIILKPSLLGGLKESEDWVEKAESLNIGWWVTSFLESNIGLNAIAQWISQFNTDMYQGLGTGQIYSNNIDCPLELDGQNLFYRVNKKWQIEGIDKI